MIFAVVSTGIYYTMNNKINALEQEKNKFTESTETEQEEYKGDCYDETMNISDDIVIKIIEKMDPSLDINFINKLDQMDDSNNLYSSIELSVSGNLNKIKDIENILNDLNINYKIENMDIKTPKTEEGNDKNYVDCLMTFRVI